MVSWVESRIVSDPKWPQCLITFAPSVFPAQLSKRNFRYWLRDPASQGTLQSFPPELGCPGLAWEFCWGGVGSGLQLLPYSQAFAFPFISFVPKIAMFLWLAEKYIYLCPQPCILRASCPEINIWQSGVSLCFYRMHSVLCALPSLCSHAFVGHVLKSMPKTCLHWFVQKSPKVEEEEEEETEKQPDPLHQIILHFSRNALTERRSAPPELPASPRHGSASPTPSSHGWQCLERGSQIWAPLLAALFFGHQETSRQTI